MMMMMMTDEYIVLVEWWLAWESRSVRRELSLIANFCVSQIPHVLPWDWTET